MAYVLISNRTAEERAICQACALRCSYGAFIRTPEFRISQFTTCEEHSLEAEVQINMGNIP